MSGFDLPPITGWDLGARPKLGDLSELRVPPEGPDGPLRVPGAAARPTGGDDGSTFASALADSLEQVKHLQDDVRAKTRGLVLGDDVELHDVLIAGAKSEAAFNLLLEVRNKLVDAWQTLSRSTV